MFNNKGMTKVWPFLTIIAILIIVALFVFWPSEKSGLFTAGQETIKIGFSGPLTGDVASWGINALAGVQLAINETNLNGGINGKFVKLIVEDDKGDSSAATLAASKLISDNVNGVILSSGSGATSTAIPLIENYKIPAVISVASAPKLTNYGDYAYRIYPSDSLQGKFIAEYIENNYPNKNIAVIYTNEVWGKEVSRIFKENFKGNLVYEDNTLIDSSDFKTIIENLISKNAEVIFCPQRPINAITMLKTMRELNYNPIVIGGDIYDSEELIKSEYAENVMYTVPLIQVSEKLENKIHSMPEYKNLNISMAAGQGYDATKIMLDAIKNTTTKDEIKNNLQNTNYISNNGAKIQFDSQGDLITGSFEIKIIHNKKSETYYKE